MIRPARTWIDAVPQIFHRHSCWLAIFAPSTSDLNLAHTMLGCTSLEPAKLAKPQIAAGVFRQKASRHLPRHLLFRVLAYRLQADRLGDLDAEYKRLLDGAATFEDAGQRAVNEALVVKAVRNHLGEINDTDHRDLINNHVARIEAQSDKLIVELAKTKAVSPKRRGRPDRIEIPWRKHR